MKTFSIKSTPVLWTLAALLTLSLAIYQRMTGPTYALKGKQVFEITGQNPSEPKTERIRYKFERSHSGNDAHLVELRVPDANWKGILEWKRFKTGDAWSAVPMSFAQGTLTGLLPGQPPAGKLQYRVRLEPPMTDPSQAKLVPGENGVVIRFKGKVPPIILVPHVIAMFTAMLLATRTGIQALVRPGDLKRLAYWTVGIFTFGGMILGPLVQLYAFDALWTGWPYGTDLTDNKTLIAWLGWGVALLMLRFARKPAGWVLGAVFVMWGIYLIPHSMFGSELDYNKLDRQKIQSTTSAH